jgi:hypothetical protein
MIPIWLAAAALTGAGSLINNRIQNDAINEQNKQNQRAVDMQRRAADAERQRQLVMERLQADEVAKALMTAAPANVRQMAAAEAADPANETVRSAEEYNVPVLQGQRSDGEVAGNIGQIVQDRLKQTREMLTAQALLTAQGTGMQAGQDGITRMGSEISTVAGNRNRSLGVSQMEANVSPAEVTKSDSPLGDLMILGGKAYGAANGSMANLPPGINQGAARVASWFRPGLAPTTSIRPRARA